MTVDGLGFEEVNQEVTSAAIISGTNIYAAGSVNAAKSTITTLGATTFSATTGSITTSVSTTVKTADEILTAGSPYQQGIIIQLPARTNISGGQWVSCSGNKAMAASVPVNQPLGVCKTTVASGGTCDVIIKGVVPMVADGTVTIETGVRPGAGAAGNTVQPYVAGSGARYATLDSAASGGTVFVLL